MSETRFIRLRDGRDYVTVEEIPGLIATALYPGTSDADLLGRAHAEEVHRHAVEMALGEGRLKASGHAMQPLEPKEAADFPDLARVAFDDFSRYAAPFGCEVLPLNSWDGIDATDILERQVIVGEGPFSFFQAHLRPVWNCWRNMAEVPLPQAVLLSFNVDGRLSIDGIEQNVARAEPLAEEPGVPDGLTAEHRRMALDGLRRVIEQRVAQCMSHIRSGTLRCRVTAEPGRQASPSEHMVSLSEFRRWGEALPEPYTFPNEFPSAARSLNWPQWRALDQVALWEAVALSFGIEPDNRILDWLGDPRLDVETADFKVRLEFAARKFPRPADHMFTAAARSPCSWTVRLREFAIFAIESAWKIPSELANLTQPPSPASQPEGPMTQRVENGYLVTIAALLELLVTRNASDRRGFPSEANLISAILAKHQGVAGLSKRGLEEKFAAAKRALNPA